MSGEGKAVFVKRIYDYIMIGSNYLDDKEEAGELIKKVRLDLHLTQYHGGIANNKLSMIEHGRLQYSKKTLLKILSSFFDAAEKMHDDIENILWPV